MTNAAPPIAPGTILLGKYRVEKVLGAGGMGVVLEAIHEQLGQPVALKFLHGEAARRPEFVARFVREAQAAARIRSEHVARVTDVGTLETGEPYLVMEHLTGRDLAEALSKNGRLPIGRAVEYVLQACEAIAEAHSLGIVHRDLKPSNLFVTRRPDGSHLVKVLDFGISKVEGPQDQSLTGTHGMMGSPLYMSPEQVRSAKRVDARSDVWSLGVVLYELLSGKTPFVADSVTGLLAAIIADDPVPLREVCPDLPEGLCRAVDGCLEKDVARRWPSVGAFAESIAPFAPEGMRASVDRISRVQGGMNATAVPWSDDPTTVGMAPISAIAANAPQTAGTGANFAPPSSTQPFPLEARVQTSATLASDAAGRTDASWGRTGAEAGTAAPRRRSKVVAVIAAAGALAVVGIAAMRLTNGTPSAAPAAAPPPEAAPPASRGSEPSPSAAVSSPTVTSAAIPTAAASSDTSNAKPHAAKGTPSPASGNHAGSPSDAEKPKPPPTPAAPAPTRF